MALRASPAYHSRVCHDYVKVTHLISNTQSRTTINIRARNPYIHQMSHISHVYKLYNRVAYNGDMKADVYGYGEKFDSSHFQ